MELAWVQRLHTHLAARVEGGNRICNLHWHDDAIKVTLFSGRELALDDEPLYVEIWENEDWMMDFG